ncbi:class I SAM-dependent methyltransferase, partial [Clavibacter californiensis]
SAGELASPGPTPADPYGPAAELFDLAAATHAELTATAVCRILDGRDLSAAPVLDIGAGTGVIARAVARSHPEALVVAAEPSEPLRAVLTARILDAPGLQERVTVTAGSAPDLELPDRLSAVLLCGVLGHLDASQRARLWPRIAERLLPGGVVVVETMGLEPGTRVPESRLARTHVGDDEVEWWFRADPAPEGLLALRTRWRSVAPDGREREVHDAYSWDPVGLEAIAREAGMDLVRLPAAAGASLPLGVLVPREADPPT